MDIQEADGNLVALREGQILLTVPSPTEEHHEVILTQVLYCALFFTNLRLASCLKRNGFYLLGGTENV